MLQSATVTIRNRGQITIPDAMREAVSWLSVGAVVRIVGTDEEVKVLPYTSADTPDWAKIREGIALARSFTGKHGNLARFIIEDRASH